MAKNREKTCEDKFNSHKKNRNEQSAHYGMTPKASRFFNVYKKDSSLWQYSSNMRNILTRNFSENCECYGV